MRILVAEDEQRALAGVVNMIHSLDARYEVVAKATDGKQALNMLRHHAPDIALMDIRMPGMSGLDVIEAARLEGLLCEFVVVSAYADFQFARRCMVMDVCEYIVKPVAPAELLRALRNADKQPSLEPAPDAHEVILHPAVRRALDLIERRHGADINQAQLAAMLRLTPEYFCTLFRQQMGTPFSQHLKQVRVRYAQTLLRQGMGVEQVAEQVGYRDEKYFRRVFREITGHPIGAFPLED